MKLGVKLLNGKAELPEFKTEGAACFDLVATDWISEGLSHRVYGTGLAFEIPKGYHLKVYSRSGHGFKDNLSLCNSVGIIDADYKGEVKVKLTHTDIDTPNWPWVGDRVAQAMLVKNVKTDIIEVQELSESERGEGGFGSTGA